MTGINAEKVSPRLKYTIDHKGQAMTLRTETKISDDLKAESLLVGPELNSFGPTI